MTDEEIICTFMEPRPNPNNPASRWWRYISKTGGGWRIEGPAKLDLDALREVQAGLTEEQWRVYESRLVGGVWDQMGNPYQQQNQYRLNMKIAHATAEQKTAALAAVLRPEMEKAS